MLRAGRPVTQQISKRNTTRDQIDDGCCLDYAIQQW
jgi:hypothetical protein